jgi:hypothetical protein
VQDRRRRPQLFAQAAATTLELPAAICLARVITFALRQDRRLLQGAATAATATTAACCSGPAYNTSDPTSIHHVAIYLGRAVEGADWMSDAPTPAPPSSPPGLWTDYIGATRPLAQRREM